MTRQDALNNVKACELTGMSTPSGRYLGYKAVEEIVNSIYDYFETIDKELTYELQNNRELAIELSELKNQIRDMQDRIESYESNWSNKDKVLYQKWESKDES